MQHLYSLTMLFFGRYVGPHFEGALVSTGPRTVEVVFQETYWMHRFMEILRAKACVSLTDETVGQWKAMARCAVADSSGISRASVRAQVKSGFVVSDELCDSVIELSHLFARIMKEPGPWTLSKLFSCFTGEPDPWTLDTTTDTVIRITREFRPEG